MEVLRTEGRRNRCSPERAFHSLSSCLNKKVQITSNSLLSVHLSWTLCAHFRPYLSLCGWCVNKHEISMLSISMKTAKRSQADNELQKFNEHLWKVGHACLRVGGRVVGQERLMLFPVISTNAHPHRTRIPLFRDLGVIFKPAYISLPKYTAHRV